MNDSRILFSLDFGLSEHLLAPGDEDNTEWDPVLGQHSYYHINDAFTSENVSYRYSYDTGEKIWIHRRATPTCVCFLVSRLAS